MCLSFIGAHKPTQSQWWGRFLSAYDTLENVIETHLLQQVFPIVLALAEEAFGAAAAPTEAVAGANDDGCLLPAPSAMWAEVLLQRALHCSNYPVQRVYLRWFFSQSRGSGEASEEEETGGGGSNCHSLHVRSKDPSSTATHRSQHT